MKLCLAIERMNCISCTVFDVMPTLGLVKMKICPKGMLVRPWGNPFWGILIVLISEDLTLKVTRLPSGEQIKQKERTLFPPDENDMKVWKW